MYLKLFVFLMVGVFLDLDDLICRYSHSGQVRGKIAKKIPYLDILHTVGDFNPNLLD